MILDNATFEKVQALVKTKGYTNIAYAGCWNENNVRFEFTRKEGGELKAGFVLNITQDFKVIKAERITMLVSRNIYGGPKNSGYKKVYDRVNLPLI